METGISINKHIYSILSQDDKLKEMVGNKIYPLIAEESTTFPFIIFKRTNINTEYSKDGVVQDTVDINIGIAAINYNQTIEISERCRELLELTRNGYFKRITLTSVYEDYVDDTYTQELTFNCILN